MTTFHSNPLFIKDTFTAAANNIEDSGADFGNRNSLKTLCLAWDSIAPQALFGSRPHCHKNREALIET